MNWDDPRFALQQASTLQIANYNQVSIGLSSAQTQDMKFVRNFIVHPNEYTRLRYEQVARSLGSQGFSYDHLLSQRIAGGATIFESWVHQLLGAAWNAVV